MRKTGPDAIASHVALLPSGDFCLHWMKNSDREGYGRTKQKGRTCRVHRIAFEQKHGCTLLPSEYVLHTCDNPSCFNPRHLFIGDAKANHQDSKSKGRHSYGERNGFAKLTEQKVRGIRASGLTQTALAREHDVSQATIWNIKHKRSWRHVT